MLNTVLMPIRILVQKLLSLIGRCFEAYFALFGGRIGNSVVRRMWLAILVGALLFLGVQRLELVSLLAVSFVILLLISAMVSWLHNDAIRKKLYGQLHFDETEDESDEIADDPDASSSPSSIPNLRFEATSSAILYILVTPLFFVLVENDLGWISITTNFLNWIDRPLSITSYQVSGDYQTWLIALFGVIANILDIPAFLDIFGPEQMESIFMFHHTWGIVLLAISQFVLGVLVFGALVRLWQFSNFEIQIALSAASNGYFPPVIQGGLTMVGPLRKQLQELATGNSEDQTTAGQTAIALGLLVEKVGAGWFPNRKKSTFNLMNRRYLEWRKNDLKTVQKLFVIAISNLKYGGARDFLLDVVRDTDEGHLAHRSAVRGIWALPLDENVEEQLVELASLESSHLSLKNKTLILSKHPELRSSQNAISAFAFGRPFSFIRNYKHMSGGLS